MEHLNATLECKFAEGGEGMIEGFGSVYNVRDLGGDVVLPGAFAGSLSSGRKVKMLAQHDAWEPIGVWDDVAEEAAGLRVRGRILTETQKGRETYALLKAGAIDGLSIGFRTVTDRWDGSTRLIEQAELWEVSVVTFPMNELARIDAVKAAGMSERDLERLLTRDAGLSRTVALRLMSGGFEAIKSMRDAGPDIADLAAFMRQKLTQ